MFNVAEYVLTVDFFLLHSVGVVLLITSVYMFI